MAARASKRREFSTDCRALSDRVGQPILAGVSSSDMHSRGASPPWTVMTGTIRLGKGVRREAGSEES
jgi:hypothetical protein